MPYLTWQIDQYNVANAENADVFKPNLKGFAVGNGCTNWDYDTNGAYVEMAYWHSLYSTEMYNELQSLQCDFSGPYMANASKACLGWLNRFDALVADVNVYDIFGICYGPDPNPQMYQNSTAKHFSSRDYTPWLYPKSRESANELPPCTFGYPIMDYLNRADVREAFHVAPEVGTWELCTNNIHYKIGSEGSQWVYEALFGKYRMLHYSGDTDGAVPTLGTQNWIASTSWESTDAWRPYYLDGQVAGYIEVYDQFTFATVHGAGHMVPQDKRPEAVHLISNWLSQAPI